MSDNIKVVVKVRPLISREIEEKQQPQWRVSNNTLFQIDSNGRDLGQNFTFDKVYCEKTNTSDVYNDVAKPIVKAAVAGFNGTIFAYGQTSSGKTYTMTGTEKSPGIIPLAVLELFKIIKNVPGRDFVVSVLYMEIYNEGLKNLLDLKEVKIHQNHDGGVTVDATPKVTASPEEVLETMNEGNVNRQTARTNMNDSSSRSHSIFQINIESREHIEGEEQSGCVNVSQLNLVDLAGSERAGQTGATGLRFKEGTSINQSLTSLALVIKSLSEDPNKFINYRDSKLTRLLQNSLGGNAKTSIICAITPTAVEQTISTLQFATRAKTIKNKPEVNAVATDATMIQKLTKELSMLQSQLERKKNLEVMLETKKNVEQDLQKKIANLQRFILNGCNQLTNVELMGGARRKLLPPRRITISTLHPIEEDVPKVPKFSTPCLKYNPSLIPNAPDFLPIQTSSKLSSLPEEPPRLITPPPNDRKVNFEEEDEIIELDSDDDESAGALTCSPYHKCYDSSKTPPCVLRKTAKQAERSLKDLVELTDREKMYTPSVVELIEKLEQKSTKTAKLQDEIEALKAITKEKDLEIESLRSKINTTEADIKNFTSFTLEIEKQRKEFSTKLTDWEVSYETLKNKAKLREADLLSLLEEQRIKQADDIGKMPSKPIDKEIVHFMDMSKDISLVNSDNESIVSPDDESSERTNILIKDMQAQLAAKNQMISELETNINDQKQQIQRLEKSNHDLSSQVYSLNDKLNHMENENMLLNTTVNELNCTIKSQKENLELARSDMTSYNSVIQELQIKLTNKDNILGTHITDAVLKSMLDNEDKTIANNENIKNLIHSLKLALENSKKEIDMLKLKPQNNNESDKDSIDDLKIKTKKIEMLNDEITKFTKQANENMVTINTLLREKGDLALIEQELVKKISEVEQKNNEYDIKTNEQALLIENLRKDNERLENTLVSKFKTEKEHLNNTNETLVKQLQEASNKITMLEEDIKTKNSQIENLNIKNNESQDCLNQAKVAINKLQDVFKILTGDVREIPEILDSFVLIYNTLNENLNVLENIAVETMAQKDIAQSINIELKNELAGLVIKHQSQISEVRNEIESLNIFIERLTNEIKLLKDKNNEQTSEIEKLKLELNNKDIELENIEKQNKDIEEVDIRTENSDKDQIITSLKKNEIDLLEKNNKLETETNSLTSALILQEKTNKDLMKKEEIATKHLDELQEKLQLKSIELAQIKETLQTNQKAHKQLVENIITKLSNIIDNIREKNSSIRNNLMFENSNLQELHILPVLDAVSDHILLQSPIEIENKELKDKMEVISKYSKSLECDLKQSGELLQQIQEELQMKSAEIDVMKQKAKELKKEFIDFDKSMNEQMQFLQSENEKLKTKSLELNKKTKMDLPKADKVTKTSRRQSLASNAENNGESSLPSLFTICCNRIIEVIDQKQNDNISATTSSLSAGNLSTGTLTNNCLECDQVSLELRTTQQENKRLMDILEQLEIVNKDLTNDHKEITEEVRLLLELTIELQKKIVSHRTNLSILTATTYTENKSLKSQVKGLQHHHSRFHNVCQRDIPEFKKQLIELLSILKDDSSFCVTLNSSCKRFSLPNLLENTLTSCQIRNESMFDGDLLMLDTNVTLTTADNTLAGYNQTCLDLTQNMLNETDCQTVDHNLTEPNVLCNQMDFLQNDKEDMSAKLEILQKDNMQLQKQISEHLTSKQSKVRDAKSSPIKISGLIDYDKDTGSFNILKEQLTIATKQKEDIEQKYNELVLKMPSTDALVHKLKALEEDLKIKVNELSKITATLNHKSKELKDVQDENDLLSTQVMEHISEADDLNKEVEQLKQQNEELLAQCQAFELDIKSRDCPQCGVNNEKQHFKTSFNENHSKLNRSLSDSDTTSRHNKICTLQSEIHAGREDCKVLTEDVATIKHHLHQSNMSMDLDDSMNFELANDSLPSSPQSKKCNMPDIQEERPLDVYLSDKNDCYNYYLDKTGEEKENLKSDIKIIELMKLLHNNLVTSHGNEVENLANQLKDYQETHTNLQKQVSDMNAEHSKIKRELEEKDKFLSFVSKVVTQLRENLSLIEQSDTKPLDFETCAKVSNVLKEKFLEILDKDFNLSSVNVFEQITGYTNKLFEDYSLTRDILAQTKYHLSEKEKEYNLLKAQNEKIEEINQAVTLDIIRKEQSNESVINETYQKLVELNVITSDEFTLTKPMNVHVLIRLLEHIIRKYQKEKAEAELSLRVNEIKEALADKEKHLNELRSQNELLQSVKIKNADELSEKDSQIKSLNIKLKENAQNLNLIQDMSEEINKLKETITNKEKVILSLYENEAKVNELLNIVNSLESDNDKLKTVNEMISNEKELYASELQKSCETIKQNNMDIDKMTSDILVLRESLKEGTAHMEKMKLEIQTLAKENVQVKQELEVKSRDCSRLEINIKTHEKTAEIQSRMIMRLQKLKEDDAMEQSKKLTDELTAKYTALRTECDALRNTIKTSSEEIEHLKIAKQTLENRLAEAEESGRRSRSSTDAVSRRRQSLHDSKRMFEESEEHKNLEAVFESKQKCDDFFDDENSGRSTPFGLGRGRDSLLSRTDHSDKDDEHPSRPSSVLAKAARRRRQSSHDLHRSVTPQASSPTDFSNYVIDKLQQSKADLSRNRLLSDNEITQLRAQLSSCEHELEELKERYRELDEECETCAEYLRERDEQCIRLKKEKTALENQVKELKKEASTSSNSMTFNIKPSVAHVAVNTDEDWTNLHSVVVDRMSYDAEVEKNKKLAKTIEELRYTKLDLKNTLAKMQKALERKSAKDDSRELEQTRKQLKASNDELRELRTRYKELDEECETCANYLKEREEQCRLLKEAKASLEAKLEELQEKSQALEHTKSMRKKRQTIHDMNRPETSTADHIDVSTETTDDFLSSQVERDDTQGHDESTRDPEHLKKMVGRLTQQKMHLEMQLRTAYAANPMYVATGSAIVQNQQITDVMKENHKLKKINAKLVNICRKRGKSANRENEDPCEQS